jgi:hypothetical protein
MRKKIRKEKNQTKQREKKKRNCYFTFFMNPLGYQFITDKAGFYLKRGSDILKKADTR